MSSRKYLHLELIHENNGSETIGNTLIRRFLWEKFVIFEMQNKPMPTAKRKTFIFKLIFNLIRKKFLVSRTFREYSTEKHNYFGLTRLIMHADYWY